MEKEFLNILLSALGVIITGVVTWGVSVLTNWLNTKIKDIKAAKWAVDITNIVADAVKMMMQTFVNDLKAEGKFDSAAQEEAKKQCLNIIYSQLTPQLTSYIKDNYGDMQKWLENKIEAVIYEIKNK